MNKRRIFTLFVLLLPVMSFTGCASIKVERTSEFNGNDMNLRMLHLKVVDNSMSSPDNIDGYINELWTRNPKKAQAVENAIEALESDFKAYGFQFNDSPEASRTIAQLEISSVRFDPVGGWITDGAVMVYRDRESGQQLGKVVACDTFITPRLQTTFRRLVEGTLQLWGITKPPNKTP